MIDGTNIFIIPQAILQTSDPTSANYNIRHGSYFIEDGKIVGKATDHIENGAEDVGGFVTFNDVVDYMDREATFCEKIYDFASMGMYNEAAKVLVEANANNKLMYQRGMPYRIALSRVENTPLEILKQRAIAWRHAYNENVDAIKRGIIKSDVHLGSFAN